MLKSRVMKVNRYYFWNIDLVAGRYGYYGGYRIQIMDNKVYEIVV